MIAGYLQNVFMGEEFMKRIISLLIAVCCMFFHTACGTASDKDNDAQDPEGTKMIVQIGDTKFTATLYDNAAVNEFVDMMKEGPVSIDMNDYSGFEKVGSLGKTLSAEDKQTTTEPGDIVLYNKNQIVMFYGSNSWSYTRIGKIDDLSGWKEALGSGSITAIFSLEADGSDV